MLSTKRKFWTNNTETRFFRVLKRTVRNPVKTRCSHLNTEGKNTEKPGTETGFFPYPPNSVDSLTLYLLLMRCVLMGTLIFNVWFL